MAAAKPAAPKPAAKPAPKKAAESEEEETESDDDTPQKKPAPAAAKKPAPAPGTRGGVCVRLNVLRVNVMCVCVWLRAAKKAAAVDDDDGDEEEEEEEEEEDEEDEEEDEKGAGQFQASGKVFPKLADIKSGSDWKQLPAISKKGLSQVLPYLYVAASFDPLPHSTAHTYIVRCVAVGTWVMPKWHSRKMSSSASRSIPSSTFALATYVPPPALPNPSHRPSAFVFRRLC